MRPYTINGHKAQDQFAVGQLVTSDSQLRLLQSEYCFERKHNYAESLQIQFICTIFMAPCWDSQKRHMSLHSSSNEMWCYSTTESMHPAQNFSLPESSAPIKNRKAKETLALRTCWNQAGAQSDWRLDLKLSFAFMSFHSNLLRILLCPL